MARYKGQISTKTVEANFPFIVEMAVPGCGFRRKIYDMEAWHRDRGIQSQHGSGSYRDTVWFVRWCFLMEADAEAFKTQFGGDRLRAPAKDRGRRRDRP